MEQNSQARSHPKNPSVATPSATLHNRIDLDPTCLPRCLACVSIVVFHVAWYVGLASDDKPSMDAALARQAWLAVVFNPEPAMQTFMCLTGYDC